MSSGPVIAAACAVLWGAALPRVVCERRGRGAIEAMWGTAIDDAMGEGAAGQRPRIGEDESHPALGRPGARGPGGPRAPRGRGQYESDETTSPLSREPSDIQVIWLIESLTNRTEPSANSTFTPPEW